MFEIMLIKLIVLNIAYKICNDRASSYRVARSLKQIQLSSDDCELHFGFFQIDIETWKIRLSNCEDVWSKAWRGSLGTYRGPHALLIGLKCSNWLHH